MEPGIFDSLIPSRYISFTLPINSLSLPTDYFHTDHLQISVLDSPSNPSNPPKAAAILVPKNRENDWIFSTNSGHLQLLHNSPGISRLILVGNPPNGDIKVGNLYKRSLQNYPFKDKLESILYPLFMALLPKEVVDLGDFEVPLLSYEDNVVASVVLGKCIGCCVGEMLVEDVEIDIEVEGSRRRGRGREFRRRLRFKRMPNLVQTEIRIVPNGVDDDDGVRLGCLCVGEASFRPNLEVLVHPYLAPMAAGLCLISGCLEDCYESRVRPRCLCIGVGGGALLSFLSRQLGFEVVGVEVDEVVLRVAKEYFGLALGDEGVHVCVGDGVEILKKAALIHSDAKLSPLVTSSIGEDCCKECFKSKFHVIMVDLDSSDSKMGISAPAMEFVDKDVLMAAKSCLNDLGILVLNVIPPSRSFYDMLIQELQELFVDLHEIDCANEENFILIASKTSVVSNSAVSKNAFLRKLKSVIPEAFVDSIRKL